jgi:arsenate reductase
VVGLDPDHIATAAVMRLSPIPGFIPGWARVQPGGLDHGSPGGRLARPPLYRPVGDWFTGRMSDFPITIFHNPKCGTSRNVLAMIRAAGHEPFVVEYLKTPWTRQQLTELMAQAGVRPRDWLRVRGTPAEALGLTGPDVTDDAILDAMVAEPILVERPIVASPKGVALCRPSEVVFRLLDAPPESFTKEDGEVVRPQR